MNLLKGWSVSRLRGESIPTAALELSAPSGRVFVLRPSTDAFYHELYTSLQSALKSEENRKAAASKYEEAAK